MSKQSDMASHGETRYGQKGKNKHWQQHNHLKDATDPARDASADDEDVDTDAETDTDRVGSGQQAGMGKGRNVGRLPREDS